MTVYDKHDNTRRKIAHPAEMDGFPCRFPQNKGQWGCDMIAHMAKMAGMERSRRDLLSISYVCTHRLAFFFTLLPVVEKIRFENPLSLRFYGGTCLPAVVSRTGRVITYHSLGSPNFCSCLSCLPIKTLIPISTQSGNMS